MKRADIASENWTIKALGYYTEGCHNFNDMVPIITQIHSNDFTEVKVFKDGNKNNRKGCECTIFWNEAEPEWQINYNKLIEKIYLNQF